MKKKLLKGTGIILPVLLVLGLYFNQPNIFADGESQVDTNEPEMVETVKKEKKSKKIRSSKFDSPEKFAELYRQLTSTRGQTESDYTKTMIRDEYVKANSKKSYKGSLTDDYKSHGPGDVGGRTRSIVVDSRDANANTWFAGSVGGGIWKTADAGQTWVHKTEGLSALSISDIKQSESNSSIFYAATGEGFFNSDAIQGDGVLKSTDGGETWALISSTTNNADFRYINRLVVSPANSDIVVAATNTGIFKTTNGGSSWTQVASGGRFQDLKMIPGDFNVQIASLNNTGVYRSIDAGDNWALVSGGSMAGGRVELAVSEKNPNFAYAVLDNGASYMFASSDKGLTWTATADPNAATNIFLDPFNRESNFSNWLGGQGWYDNTLAVHPYDETKLMMGGVNLSKTEVNFEDTVVITTKTVSETASWGQFVNEGIHTPAEWGTDLPTTEIDVELVFGPGKSQKAHRFRRSGGMNYEDYSDVPFEAWDRTNNRQLMVSWRDRNVNGRWDLLTAGSSNWEYLFIHDITYDSTTVVPEIAVSSPTGDLRDGSQTYKLLYVIWMQNPNGGIDDTDMNDGILSITWPGTKHLTRSDEKVSHWFSHSQITFPYVHADQHHIKFIKKNETAKTYLTLVGNDGGIWASVDGGKSWKDRSRGYVTSQFYGADMSPGKDDGHGHLEYAFVGGMQDNGSDYSNFNPEANSAWNRGTGGDGFEVVWHQVDPLKLATTVQYGRINISTDGGESFSRTLNLGQNNASFVTALANAPLDPDLLATIGIDKKIYMSRDFGQTWSTSDLVSVEVGNSNKAQVKFHDANPNIMWAGAYLIVDPNNSFGGKVNYSLDQGRTWNSATGIDFNGPSDASDPWYLSSDIATHPSKDSTVFVSVGNRGVAKIMRSQDMGQTWEDISGISLGEDRGFPDVPVYAVLAIERENATTKAVTEEIWAGTEIGIFVTKDDGASWTINNNFPNTSVWDLKRRQNRIVIASHGRGVWSVELSDFKAAPVPPLTPLFTVTPSFAGQVTVDYDFRSTYDSAMVVLTNLDSTTSFVDTALVAVVDTGKYTGSVTFNYANRDSINRVGFNARIRVAGYIGGVEYRLDNFQAFLAPKESGIASYGTNFEGTHDLVGAGFSVQQPTGFSSNFIGNTAHPYGDAQTLYLTLDKVIRVDSVGSMSFDEVAIVEPGDGTDLWDYVAVEGSPDGSNWTELTPRYDADAYPHWRSIYDAAGAPVQKDMRNRSINLLTTFSEGDDIKLRFKLLADAATTGWGWAIDNLYIQEEAPVIVEPDGQNPSNFGYTFIQNPVFKRNAYLAVETAIDIYNDQLNGNYYHSVNGTARDLNFNKLDSVTWLEKGISLDAGNNSNLVVALTGYGIKASGAKNDTAFHDTLSVALVFTSSKTKNVIQDIEFDVAANGNKSSLPIAKVHGSYENELNGMTRVTTAIVGYKAVTNDKEFSVKFNLNKHLVEGSQVYRKNANGWHLVDSDKLPGSIRVTEKEFGTYAVFVDNKVLEHASTIPTEYALYQNAPNPFNPVTTIPFKLKDNAKVSLVIYNALGQKVKTLVSGRLNAGTYRETWNGSNDLGRKVASGIYFYKLITPSKVFTKKMVLIK